MIREVHAGGFVRVAHPLMDEMGFATDELSSRALVEWIHSEDRERIEAALGGEFECVRARHRCQDGGWIELDWTFSEVDGTRVALGRTELPSSYKVVRSGVEETTAIRETMGETLDAMIRFVEDINPGLKSSVLILDESGSRVSVGAGPSLPSFYNEAVEGLAIGPLVGSCGTAAFWSLPVIVENIQEDPLWRDLAEKATAAGLCACWSLPIYSNSGDVIGAMALYAAEPSAPTETQLSHLEMASRMVGAAVDRGRSEMALRRSETEARDQARLLSALTGIVTSFVEVGDWHAASRELIRAAAELTGSRSAYLVTVDEGVPRILEPNHVWTSKVERLDDDLRQWSSPMVIGKRALELHRDVFQRVISTRSPQSHESEPGVPGEVDSQSKVVAPLQRLLCAPIQIQGEVVAILGVADRQAGAYGIDARQRVEVLANTASGLLDSFRRRQHEQVLEEQLRQAGKMEALGVLAGRIAHDFNNLLVAILGNAELAMETLERDSAVQEMLEGVVNAGNRAADLCRQMLAYAGRGALSKQRLDCNSVFEELNSMMQVAVSQRTTLEFDLHDGPLMAQANKTQLRQVVMNLITNAEEAFDGQAGRITVRASRVHMQANELRGFKRGTRLEGGNYIQISVSDTGPGMSPETQIRVFEPFYTTKSAGRGLGLAAVQGIVLGHKGGIRLESQLGAGTVFTILLPLADCLEDEVSEAGESINSGSTQRILVVDDEEAVRNVTAKLLEHAGFEVVCAVDGEDAVQVFERDPGSIDCVLLDLSMPRLDGEATFKELRRIRSDIRVVLNSGFTESEMLERFEGAGFAGVLQKPFPSKALIEKLRSVMV